jgi:hypothetical protein
MIKFSKSEKRELRSLADNAYAIEMERELAKLEAAFASWRKGELKVFELDEQIHTYYSGPHKELYKSYRMLNQPETMVARALAIGLLKHDQLSVELLKKIALLIQFFKENR